ncbi:MAG: cupin domain-containing protein [Bacteroidales bacterium]|nr:cupin domain-containing protein [Bacteroidales bacterium]
MQRGKFILSAFLFFPFTSMVKLAAQIKTRTNNGFKVSAGEARFGRHFKMKGVTLNVLDIKISSKDTDGAIAVFEQNGFTPNGGPPLHIHLYQDEFFYIVEGEYLFQVGEEKFQMKPGDTIFLPRNIQHAFAQLSEKGKVIVSYMPAGKMEDFFRITDSWTIPPSKEEIIRVFKECDMDITGPPLTVA